jgi:hypothetical protein
LAFGVWRLAFGVWRLAFGVSRNVAEQIIIAADSIRSSDIFVSQDAGRIRSQPD